MVHGSCNRRSLNAQLALVSTSSLLTTSNTSREYSYNVDVRKTLLGFLVVRQRPTVALTESGVLVKRRMKTWSNTSLSIETTTSGVV